MKTTLNTIELSVLISLNKQSIDYTGGEFGFMPYVNKKGLTDKEFAGYISSLKSKDVFEYLNTEGGVYGGQFAINTEFKQPNLMKHYAQEMSDATFRDQ